MLLLQAWWLICGTLVFLMIVGFLLLESGWVENRHIEIIATKCVCMLFASVLSYGLIGFGLMYGVSWHGVVGNPFEIDPKYNYPAWFFYQAGFASVAGIIISGAMAGRTTLLSNVLCAAFISGVVFPIHGHWIWHYDGILHAGSQHLMYLAHDYAGSAAVHWVGGIAALVGCLMAGKRSLRDDQQHKGWEPTPHLAAAGVLILVLGWIGFNGGSIADAKDIVEDWTESSNLLTALTGTQVLKLGKFIQFTILAASSGAFAAFIVSAYIRFYKNPKQYLFDSVAVLSGAMAGMVAVTAWCDRADAPLAVIVGAIGGIGSFLLSKWLRRYDRFDDPVEAVAVHAGGGFVGVMSFGFWDGAYLRGQCIDLAISALLTAVVVSGTLGILIYLSRFSAQHLFKANEDDERIGLSVPLKAAPGSQSFNKMTFWIFASLILSSLVFASFVILKTLPERTLLSVGVLGTLICALFSGVVLIWRRPEAMASQQTVIEVGESGVRQVNDGGQSVADEASDESRDGANRADSRSDAFRRRTICSSAPAAITEATGLRDVAMVQTQVVSTNQTELILAAVAGLDTSRIAGLATDPSASVRSSELSPNEELQDVFINKLNNGFDELKEKLTELTNTIERAMKKRRKGLHGGQL